MSWQQMDCPLSYCLTTALSSVILHKRERLGFYFLGENGNCVCDLRVLMEPCSLKCILHFLFLFLRDFCLIFLFLFFFWSALENIRHILSYRLFLYKAASLYACCNPNNYVTTKLFVIVHVCQYLCRAFFPIMSISICIITNKCVYTCLFSPSFTCHCIMLQIVVLRKDTN